MQRIIRISVLLLLGSGLGSPVTANGDGPSIDPRAETILQGISQHLAGLDQFGVTLRTVLKMPQAADQEQLITHYELNFRRPNKLAAVLTEGMGATVVSDGDNLYTYVPQLGRYTVAEVPQPFGEVVEELSALMDIATGGLVQKNIVHLLFSNDPIKQLMRDVASCTYEGLDDSPEERRHHLKFQGPAIAWDLWVAAGAQPLPRTFVYDLSPLLAESHDAPQRPADELNLIQLVVHLEKWQTEVDLPDSAFTFKRPPSAVEVESLVAEQRPQGGLLGKPAPAFELPLLGGGDLNLSEHLGRRIIVLDFWASWCGPCVAAMPEMIAVAEAYQDKDVAVFAVNQMEAPRDVEKFLAQHGFQVIVPLDQDGQVSNLYDIYGLPQTVIIDQAGTVQAVHLGYVPKAQLAKELDTLLAGKRLIAEPETVAPQASGAKTKNANGLERIWSLKGAWVAVASDRDQRTLFATTRDGQILELDSTGERKYSFKTGTPLSSLRVASRLDDDGPGLICFRVWDRSVTALRRNGQPLWTYATTSSINDASTGDLDGDGRDETVLGFNGSGGIHVLDPNGKLIWKHEGIADVWQACIGNITGDTPNEVITTSGSGKLHLFDAKGSRIRDVGIEGYATLVRLFSSGAEMEENFLLAGSTVDDRAVLIAVDEHGNKKWSLPLPEGGTNHMQAIEPAGAWPYAAIVMRGGLIHVADLTGPQLIGSVRHETNIPKITWLQETDGGVPLLVVADGQQVCAYRVAE